MIGKFNLYDFIAVVIPGLLFLWVMSIFAAQIRIAINIPFSGGIGETSVLIALSYVMGLLLQGVSQGLTEKVLLWVWGGFPSARWLLPEDTRLSTEYKNKILQIIKQKYGFSADEPDEQLSPHQKNKVILQKNQEIFYLCYNAVEKEKLGNRPQIFNAQYGLFRCLLTVFIMIIVIAVTTMIFADVKENRLMLAVGVFSLVGTTISYWRVKKRADDFAKSVYDLFLVHYGKAEL